jgi:sRNA-binding carbon storage regulator CsrA
VPVHREEIYERIQRERAAASTRVPDARHAANSRQRGRRLNGA